VLNRSFQDKSKDDSNLQTKPNLYAYLTFMEQECRIKRSYYLSDGKIKLRSLNGPEKLRLFEGISTKKFANIVPSLPKVSDVDLLWQEFIQIYLSLTNNSFDKNILKISTSSWLERFVSIYQSVTVTPYMHIFAQHLHEMVELHGDISLFTMQGEFSSKEFLFNQYLYRVLYDQGLEKLNDITTKHYFNSTNRNENFLEQLLNKRNRMESMYLESNDLDTQFD
jgi:hypothetical protein